MSIDTEKTKKFGPHLDKLISRMRSLYWWLAQRTKLGEDNYDCEHCPLHDFGCAMVCYDLRDILEHWDKRPKAKYLKNINKKGLGKQ